jgi:L-asparaginase II
VPLVAVERSGTIESLHTGHLLVVAADGSDVAVLGDVEQPIFPRSSNKPLQAIGLRRLGLDVDPPTLALAAASHSGEPVHIAIVERLLADFGFSADELICPPDWPLSEAARNDWIAHGGGKTRIRMNCSGKHAAMLATCRINGWDTDGYADPGHPLQQSLRATIEELGGAPVAAIGVDGCGAPIFSLSLRSVARAFRHLATAEWGADRDVANAIRAHPELAAGTDRAATRLMEGISGLIAKDGAEGVFVAALPDGAVVAVKIDDGAARAAESAVAAGLALLRPRAQVTVQLASAAVLGGGRPVGAVRFVAGLR